MNRPPLSAVLGAVLAFGLWGVLPVYWKQLSHIGADITVAHRVFWTMLSVVPMLWWSREWRPWTAALRKPSNWTTHAWSGLLLTINWGTFIWAANHNQIVDCSLGYFINPLLNVFIGSLLLGEVLRPLQKLSITLAAVGVLLQILALGRFPWIGLTLALSMAFYALARRRSALGSLTGLATETLVFLPFAMAFLGWTQVQHRSVLGHQDAHDLLFIAGLGIITAVPLLGFAHAARQLPFALLGLLQFLAPTGQFLTGVLVYHEPFTMKNLVSFAFIWAGVALFCVDLWKSSRRRAA